MTISFQISRTVSYPRGGERSPTTRTSVGTKIIYLRAIMLPDMKAILTTMRMLLAAHPMNSKKLPRAGIGASPVVSKSFISELAGNCVRI